MRGLSSEYALANDVTHPRNTLRQAVVLDPLDSWLADKFDRTSLTATIDELAVAAATPAGPGMWHRDVAAKIATVTASSQYRAALDAGGDPVVIDRWITETEAARATYEAMQAPEAPAPVLTRDEIAAAEALAGLPALLRGARTGRQGRHLLRDRTAADLPASAADCLCQGQARGCPEIGY